MPTVPPRPAFKKSLGQHHLRHPELCLPAIDFLRPRDRVVLEIGPGGGVLTVELMIAGATVVGLELDRSWAFELQRRTRGRRLSMVVADGLEWCWERLQPHHLVAGNLPFNVASPIIEAFATRASAVERAVFLVQDEVARRLTAAPGNRDYGMSTVLVGAWAEVSMLSRVRPGSFEPVPRVWGAFIGLRRREPPLPALEMKSFRKTVAAGFRQRRKTLANSLRSAWGREPSVAALSLSGLDGGRRAETLSVADFAALHRGYLEAIGGKAE